MTPNNATSPIINRPYDPPEWHWQRHRDGRIANLPAQPGRYPATGRLPKVAGLSLQARNRLESMGDVSDRLHHLEMVNDIRREVQAWQNQGYPGTTRVTRELIGYWTDPDKDGLYFAQKEAVLTAIWLTEVASSTAQGQTTLKELDEINSVINDGVPRVCHQMATGTGKTAVMAALILWQTCNHQAYPGDIRFTNRFLAITPGITVQERLKAGLEYMKDGQPDPTTEYLNPQLRLTPPKYESALRHIRLTVVNYHKFIPRDPDGQIPKRAKELARKPSTIETEEQVIKRVLGQDAEPLVVFDDEAHHCHHGNPARKATDDQGRFVWFNALRTMYQHKLIHGAVRDLSATPSFIQGTTNDDSTPLFPWIISQYDLQEAEEAGIVKIMRLPDENRPTEWSDELARSIYANTKDDKTLTREEDDSNNRDFKIALKMMYENWLTVRQNSNWSQRTVPPVLAVVVNEIGNANRIYDHIAGWKDGEQLRPGRLGNELSNIDVNAVEYHEHPRTILVHSRLDEPDSNQTGETKRYLDHQADIYRRLYPEAITAGSVPFPRADSSDVLRTVLNTVGKSGQPGERVRCVVSVGMLTEGWDARTVTHIVGFRRFGTQLICEQVSGRALRRVAYDADEEGYLYPEYADILGIPFNNLNGRESSTNGRVPPQPPPHYDVRVMPERSHLNIRWPNVVDFQRPRGSNPLSLQPPTDWAVVPPHTVKDHDNAERVRTLPDEPAGEPNPLYEQAATCQEFQYLVAKHVVDRITEVDHEEATVNRTRLFQDSLAASQAAQEHGRMLGPTADAQWPNRYTEEPGSAAAWLMQHTATAIDATGVPIVTAVSGDPEWLDTRKLLPYQSNRITKHDTDKSEVNVAVCDSSWESRVAEILDLHPEVAKWIRNERLGWTIPYRHDGMSRQYEPDFVAVAPLGNGHDLHILIEVKGLERPTDADKQRWTTQYWIPAVNAHPEYSKFGPWAFLYLDKEPMEAYVLDAISQIIENANMNHTHGTLNGSAAQTPNTTSDLLADSDSERSWDELFQRPESEDLLERMANAALAEYRAGTTQPLDPEQL